MTHDTVVGVTSTPDYHVRVYALPDGWTAFHTPTDEPTVERVGLPDGWWLATQDGQPVIVTNDGDALAVQFEPALYERG
jgi:hypothetical protein